MPSRAQIACLFLALGLNSPAWGQGLTPANFLPRSIVSSTVPPNGDLNPYGVAIVPPSFPATGALKPGDVLVSNFNNSANLQGTGTTIVQLTPSGSPAPLVAPGSNGSAKVFFASPLKGLTTALGVLRGGFVIVGNVPTVDGTYATLGQGALQVLNASGAVVATWKDPATLDSPWDLAIRDDGAFAQIFVSNVISTKVVRLDVAVGATVTLLDKNVIASGYSWAPNPSALVVGPTGLVYNNNMDALFVASTADNAIYRVDGASERISSTGRGVKVFADPHLRGPVGLAAAPNGDLLAANGDAINGNRFRPSEIVEFTQAGVYVAEFNIDAGQGGAFGLAVRLGAATTFNFAAVDDVANVVMVNSIPH